MKTKCLLSLLLLFIISCTDQKEIQTISDDKIEVKFNVLKDDSTNPEYELTFLLGKKVVAKRVYKNGQEIVARGIIPNSQVVEQYENGRIKNLIHFKNGKREGKAIGFFLNGRVKIETTYKNNNPIGVTKTYYESGQLQSESEIKDDTLIYYNEYYENGIIKEKVVYENGNSISTTYDVNGKQITY